MNRHILLEFIRTDLAPGRLVPGLGGLGIVFGVAFALVAFGGAAAEVSLSWSVAGVAALVLDVALIPVGIWLANRRYARAFNRAVQSHSDRVVVLEERRAHDLRAFLAERGLWNSKARERLVKDLEFALQRARGRRPDLKWATSAVTVLLTSLVLLLAKSRFDSDGPARATAVIAAAISIVAILAGLSLAGWDAQQLLRRSELDLEDAMALMLDLEITASTEDSAVHTPDAAEPAHSGVAM
jgi:hypothetical protein